MAIIKYIKRSVIGIGIGLSIPFPVPKNETVANAIANIKGIAYKLANITNNISIYK
jgi:hypothetical protein